MSVELYDEKGAREYAIAGIQRKIIEMTGRIKIFLESGSWILENTPPLKEKVTCIGDLVEKVSFMLNDGKNTENIIPDSNLDHEIGNYLANLASIERIDKNRFNLGASGVLIKALNYKTDEFLEYLSNVTDSPKNLKSVLIHSEREEEDKKAA